MQPLLKLQLHLGCEMSWISPACGRHWEPHCGVPVGMTVLAWMLQMFEGVNTSAGEGEEDTGKGMRRRAVADPLAQTPELHQAKCLSMSCDRNPVTSQGGIQSNSGGGRLPMRTESSCKCIAFEQRGTQKLNLVRNVRSGTCVCSVSPQLHLPPSWTPTAGSLLK